MGIGHIIHLIFWYRNTDLSPGLLYVIKYLVVKLWLLISIIYFTAIVKQNA